MTDAKTEEMQFERPRTLFGKTGYFQEQSIINSATTDIQTGIVLINPDVEPTLTPILKPIITKLPIEWRKKRATTLLTKGLEKLRNVGI